VPPARQYFFTSVLGIGREQLRRQHSPDRSDVVPSNILKRHSSRFYVRDDEPQSRTALEPNDLMAERSELGEHCEDREPIRAHTNMKAISI
jgi:hypothetical protein